MSSSGSGRSRGAVGDFKQTQAASSARNRSAAAEADTIGEHANQEAAAEADAIGKQQLKRTQIGKQQLCTESCPAPDYTRRRMRGK